MIHFTEEQIQGIVDGAAEKLRDSIVTSTKENIANRVQYAIDSEVATIVSEFFKEHVRPELEGELIRHRDQIVKQIALASVSAGEVLANRLSERAAKNLAEGWNADEIIKALFRR